MRRFYPSAVSSPEINIPYSNPDAQQISPSETVPLAVQDMSRDIAPTAKASNPKYEQYRETIDTAARNNGLDSELIQAIIQVESAWKPNAHSKAGAMGLMQLMPATARGLGVQDAYDPEQNIAGGAKYIAQLIKQFGGDVSKALMAYNCGPGNVRRGRIPAASKNYAKKVMSIYRSLQES